MNAKACKALRRVAQQVYGAGRGGHNPHFAQRRYEEVHYKETQVNPATGKPYLTRDTAEPITIDAVRQQPQPIRLSDGTPRSLYRKLKQIHRRVS